MATEADSASAQRRQCDITRHENYLRRKARVCEQCGKAFTEGRLSAKQLAAGKVQRYCSKACTGDSRRLYATAKEAKRAEQARWRERNGLPPTWVPTSRECVACSKPFIAAKRSSFKCVRCSAYRKVPKQTKPCADCGKPIIGTAGRRICKACARKRSRTAQREKHGSTKKHRLRARRFGVAYEPVNPTTVFERDKWTCQLCGSKTPRRLRGKNQPTSPELDHIVPLAAGGEHSYRNTQCACRTCNLAKSSRPLGQLRLFA